MNLIPNNFNINNIYYSTPINNSIFDNGKFIKLCYSNNDYNLNGIYIPLSINIISKEYYNNKIKYNYNISDNINNFKNILHIEDDILNKLNINNYNIEYNLKKQFLSNNIRVYKNADDYNNDYNSIINILLKISGICINNNTIGLIYKFIEN